MRILAILFFLILWMGTKIINADDILDKETDQEILRHYTQNWLGDDPIWKKYIQNVIYVGMPEKDFVKLFTNHHEFQRSLRPYIVEYKNNTYYIYQPEYDFLKRELKQTNIANTGKSRIKFDKGRLAKYEMQYWDKPPFVFLVYSDQTNTLRGFTAEDKGFYDGMPEKEFLKFFSGSILRHKRDWYIFWGKNRKKYRITFYNGYLTGVEPL